MSSYYLSRRSKIAHLAPRFYFAISGRRAHGRLAAIVYRYWYFIFAFLGAADVAAAISRNTRRYQRDAVVARCSRGVPSAMAAAHDEGFRLSAEFEMAPARFRVNYRRGECGAAKRASR